MKYRFMEPLEKERSSSYGSNFFMCKSRKLSRRVTAFGTLSFDNMMILETDAHVRWYCERPMKTDFFMDGEQKKISPDFYVSYDDGTDEFQWVRSRTDDKTEELEKLVSSWGRQSGEHTRLLTEEDIRKGPFYMRNLYLIAARSRRCDRSEKASDRMFLEFLRDSKAVAVGTLIKEGYLSREKGFTYISDLYFRGLIDIRDIHTMPLSYKTEVSAHEH